MPLASGTTILDSFTIHVLLSQYEGVSCFFQAPVLESDDVLSEPHLGTRPTLALRLA